MPHLPGHIELLPVRQSFASRGWPLGCHEPMPRLKWQTTECRCRKHRSAICIRSTSPCHLCCFSCRICRIPAANPPDFQAKSGMAAKQDDGSGFLLPFSLAMQFFRPCSCGRASSDTRWCCHISRPPADYTSCGSFPEPMWVRRTPAENR